METIELIIGKLKNIDIEFISYIGAESVYGLGCSSNYQMASGRITPQHWPEAQATMWEMLPDFDDEKKYFEYNELTQN